MSFLVPVPGTILSRDIADYPEGIVLPVDKPYRWTSADVIRKLKWNAIRFFGKKNLKVGHAGTLDPLATGVLLVCIGPACKRAQELQDHPKEYIAHIRFGATTPSYDLEKDVDRRFPSSHITAASVREALSGFLGEQEQVAPLFSAKSVDGVRAYEMARKLYKAQARQSGSALPGSAMPDSAAAGSAVSGSALPGSAAASQFDTAALETLQRSRIVISELELLDFAEGIPSEPSLSGSSHPSDGPLPLMPPGAVVDSGALSAKSARINVADTSALGLPEAVVRIACSKGTYIRAFARDLGEALGSGAHLFALSRTRSGSFPLPTALSLDQALALFKEPL